MTLSTRVRRVARALALMAGAAFMALAFDATADRLDGGINPGVPRLAAATLLLAGNILLTGWAWALLMGGDRGRRRALAGGFYVSLLGKYVPGGMWQAVGQVGAARRAGLTLGEATTGFTAFAVVQLVGGAVLGAGIAVAGAGVPAAYRWPAAGGLLALVLLDRRWMVWAVRRVPKRGPVERELVPAQHRLLQAALATAAGSALAGAAFAVVLGGLDGAPLPTVSLAWCLSWAVGFAAVVIPAGLGIREAVLVALLAAVADTPALIAASVYHRLATIVSEGLVIAVHRVLPRRPDDPSVDSAVPS